MLIADSHEFLELYRGDRDVRMGVEMLRLRDDISFVSFAPDKASPVDWERFGSKRLRDIGLPDLPPRFDLQLLPSAAIRFKKKDSGGILSLMPGYGRALRNEHPDVIVENPYSWLTPRSYQTYHYSKKTNTPVVYYDPGDDIPITAKHRLMAHWESPVIGHASSIITYTHAGRDRFINKYDYPSQRIHVIPKPVDVASCRYRGDSSELRASFGAGPATLVVGYVGRLAEYKGSGLLLDVAQMALRDARLEGVLFLFVGAALASSEDESRYHLPNTHVTGMVPHDDVPKYLAACDVVAYPERNPDFGGFSTSIAETMAAGKAIVCGMKHPGYYVPLEDGVTALVVPPNDPQAVAAALRQMVETPHLAERLGRAVGSYASRNMDYPVVAKEYLDIIDSAVDEARRGETGR